MNNSNIISGYAAYVAKYYKPIVGNIRFRPKLSICQIIMDKSMNLFLTTR